MAYIGNKPTVGNFQICDAISVVNGQAAYTMQVGSVNVIPQSANHMIVSLNGTIQKPNSSFTVSGSTITFASNLVTNDVIDFIQILGDVLDLGVPSDATVTTAKLADDAVTTAKVADDAITAAKLNNDIISGTTALTSEPADTDEFLVSDAGTLKRIDYSLIKGGGITGADFWRLNGDVQFGTGTQVLDSNWERVDSDNYGVIGSAMTESSGIFTFPSTGIWLIQHQVSIFRSNGEIQRHDSRITMTTNNSSYDDAAFSHMSTDHDNYRQSTCFSFIFDCENTSTHKIRFTYSDASNNNPTLVGATNATCTGAMFVRLGDT